MINMFVIAFLLLIVAYLCALAVRYETKRQFAKNIPEIYGMPFFGLLFDIYGLNSKKAYSATMKYVYSHEEKIVKHFATPMLMYLTVTDPEYVKKLLNSPNALNKSFIYKFLEWKRSLLTADVERWQPLRRHFNKAFSLSNLKTFIGIFDRNSRKLVNRIEKHTGQGSFDLMDYVLLTALSNICATSVGLEFEDENLNTLIVKSFQKFHNLVIEQMFGFHHWFTYLSALTPTYWKKRYLNRLINRHLFELVKKRAQVKLKAGNKAQVDDGAKIFLDQIISLNATEGTNFTDEDVVADTNLLISASLASNSNLLCHAIIFLAIHPKVQERVRQEAFKYFPNPSDPITYDGLTAMTYTDMVIKETLRLAPSIGTMVHKTTGDVELDENLIIPKGNDVIISIIAIHRLKHIWGPDADSFNPNRFTPEEMEKRHTYSFIPFSMGPRNCIGYKYAMLAAKTMLVHLLRAYQFKTPYRMIDLEFETNIHVSLTIPYLVSIEKLTEGR